MNIPKELNYTSSHLWISEDSGEYTMGLTDFAQDQMGDILFVDLPPVGDSFGADEVFCELESSKSTQELTFPFDIQITAVNESLDDSPEGINEDPYGNWILKFKADDVSGFMDADAYEEICVEE